MAVARPTSRTRATVRGAAFALAVAVLALGLLASIAFGAANIEFSRAFSLLLTPDDSADSLVVWTLRLPRALAAALAGAALGVSGALLQGVTRNPLADPGILGVEAGAALAILIGVVFLPGLTVAGFVPLAFLGGLLAALLALGIARGVGLTPLRLALAGVAVASFVGAGSRTLQILFEDRATSALFSLSGSVANRTWTHVYGLTPWVLVGLGLAFLVARRVNVLALGEDLARGLGMNSGRETLLVTLLGVLLAASAVSVVGPIGFVGLIVPHLARWLVGVDHRLVLPLCALLGGALLVWADVAARLVDRPAETPVGILIAVLGAPFFVLLARRLKRAE